MKIYVDIDGTICTNENGEYKKAKPRFNQIKKINELYNKGNEITYWTARGSVTKTNWYDITKEQLDDWGCEYHKLSVGKKPHYDLLICDKTKRIEEI